MRNLNAFCNVGNAFLVRGCEKTMAQIQETGAVAKSAASHLLITEMHDIKQCRKEKKSKNGYVIGSGYLTRKSK